MIYTHLIYRNTKFKTNFPPTDNTQKNVSYLLKTCHSASAEGSEKVDALGAFDREIEIYRHIIPAFEQIYANKGKHVTFGPKSFWFSEHPGIDNIVLEDLKVRNFKNADRLKGLDMDHCKGVLKLIAEFHAASAVYYEQNGPYPDNLTVGIFREDLLPIFVEFNKGIKSVLKPLMTSMKEYKNGEYYAGKLFRTDHEAYYKKGHKHISVVNYDQFNVLNHGDIWSNNIMFSYDDKQHLKETCFVDFQMSKYGSPIYDLYYFILSSAALDIKLDSFDFFIKYYHDHLIENLKLLEYKKNFPTLQSLHLNLLSNGFAAEMVAVGLMGTVLLDPTDSANMGSFLSDEQAGNVFRRMIYTNPKYIKAMNDMLPWLDNKGFLD